MSITAKEKAADKILNYLSDPDNNFISRAELSIDVLGYKNGNQVNCIFTSEELAEIENKALEIRKKGTAKKRSTLLDKLYDFAIDGDVQAAKEYLNRTEGKVKESVDVQHKRVMTKQELTEITEGLNL